MNHLRTRVSASVSIVVVAVACSAIAPSAVARDRDCSDFKNQRQAQKFFKKHHGSKRNDPHRLDADHDGKACEDSY